MPITISDSSFIIDGSKAAWTVPSPVLFVGEIARLYNSSSTTQTYNYTDIYGINATTSVSPFTSSYILAKSGSVQDSYNSSSFISAIELFLTASELGNTFTEQLITTTGAGTWTKPTGVTDVIVECWGGGGAGGGCTVTNGAGGGGAGGQYARKYIKYASPSQNVSYTVGVGGVGGTGIGPSGSDTTWATNQVVAKGGAGGEVGVTRNPPVLSSLDSGLGASGSIVNGIGDLVKIASNQFIIQSATFLNPNGANGTIRLAGGSITVGDGGIGGYGPGSTPNGEGSPNITSEKEFGGRGGATNQIISNGGDNGNSAIAPTLYGSGGSGAVKLSGANRSGGDGTQGLIRILYR